MLRERARSVCLVLALSLVVTLVGAPAAVPQCRSTCMGAVGAGMTCTLTITMTFFPPAPACPPLTGVIGTTYVRTMGMLPTVCPPGGPLPNPPRIMGIAHPATATGPATCGFMITVLCFNPTMTMTPARGAMLTCTVGPMSPGGGLPVELMEFSVEDEAESESGETSG